ncbi:MAG TPA: ATP-binding cassette domain-containing protein [Acidobacteriota bacterium]|nr:ATP-binding cassette domain-containing protein [Acidobacteriota bacterium]
MIRFEHVTKTFAGERVLDDFSMSLQPAETKVILGGGGSGKSTILKMVLGLVKPDSGRVYVDGEDITEVEEEDLMPLRRQIGMVFQEGALFDSLTVGENVGYRLIEEGRHSHQEVESIVHQVLGFVGLEHAVGMMPSELSGGMRRRVGIARALAGKPRIVLYDEPTAGLDPITSRTISELIMKLRDLEGVTSILVTHDLTTAMILASEIATVDEEGETRFRRENGEFCLINTRFVMLKEGRVLFEGPDELLREFDDGYVKEFLD